MQDTREELVKFRNSSNKLNRGVTSEVRESVPHVYIKWEQCVHMLVCNTNDVNRVFSFSEHKLVLINKRFNIYSVNSKHELSSSVKPSAQTINFYHILPANFDKRASAVKSSYYIKIENRTIILATI